MSSPRPPKRRPSKGRFALRRLGALAVVVLVGYSLVKVTTDAFGSDESVAGADDSTVVDTDGSDPTAAGATSDGAGGDDATGADTSDSSGTDDTDDTEPAATEPETTDAPGPATTENPAKVFIVGDSDAGTFGPYLETLLDGTQIVDTELDYKVSSGLARPDFFDWPAELANKLPEVDPDIVVATFGGNDANILRDAAGNDLFGYPESDPEGWTAEYQQRVGEAMDLMLEDGRTLIWVGIPNDDNPDVTARMAIQDQAAKAAAAERPEVVFIDTWKRFSGRDGGWAEFVIDPRDGQGKDVRADDGFHLNTTGAEILALDIAQAVRDSLRADGAEI